MAKPKQKKKVEKDYAKKLYKWGSNDILSHLTAKLRILVYFSREEITEDKIKSIELLRQVIHEHTSDIIIGTYQCKENDPLYQCDDEKQIFPRFRFFDKTDKEVTYSLEKGMNFSQLIIKTKELIVPEQKTITNKEELEEFLKKNKYSIIANIDKEDRDQTATLNELVKASKFGTSLVFDIANLQIENISSTFPEYKEQGIYFHTINSDGVEIFKKYPYGLQNNGEDVKNILGFFEMESYPEVFHFNSKLFKDIFANHIDTQFIYFTEDPDSVKTKEAEKILRRAAIHNRNEDLLSQRVAFVIFKIGINPGVEASFSDLKDGDAFLTYVGSDNFFRYHYTNPFLTKENIIEFMEDFRAGRLEEYLISEPPHEEEQYLPDSNILIVPASQYREKIIRSKENFLVMFCSAPEACDQTISSLKLLSKITDSGILRYAYVNAEKNEVKGLHHPRFPNFILYIEPYKAQPKVYDLDLDFPTLTGWLNTYAPSLNLQVTHEMIFENYYYTRSDEEKKKIQEAVEHNYYNIPNVSIDFVNQIIEKDKHKKQQDEAKTDL